MRVKVVYYLSSRGSGYQGVHVRGRVTLVPHIFDGTFVGRSVSEIDIFEAQVSPECTDAAFGILNLNSWQG
jgi:hypothetical protein